MLVSFSFYSDEIFKDIQFFLIQNPTNCWICVFWKYKTNLLNKGCWFAGFSLLHAENQQNRLNMELLLDTLYGNLYQYYIVHSIVMCEAANFSILVSAFNQFVSSGYTQYIRITGGAQFITCYLAMRTIK